MAFVLRSGFSNNAGSSSQLENAQNAHPGSRTEKRAVLCALSQEYNSSGAISPYMGISHWYATLASWNPHICGFHRNILNYTKVGL